MIVQAETLISGLSFDKLLGDRGLTPIAFAAALHKLVPRP
jgi:hypothetical protein